ncbi:hypothetical protein [Streptomyces sp. NPDC008125]|uniref:hypothetical protein n=1 Tax=Streptomyces sp. NPDC008125 TaxID=3364811 RepID=UPI0036E86792
MVQKPERDIKTKERRIDLNVPQVAGSAVAAVAAAVAASQLGVYGTILGAGVMSIVATCGGSVFQHFFRRTGEQIREVTVQVTNPGGRQVAVRTRETTRGRRGATYVPAGADGDPTGTRVIDRAQTIDSTLLTERTRLIDRARPSDADRTRMLRPSAAADTDRTRLLRAVPATAGEPDDATRQLRITGPGLPPGEGGPDEGFSAATTHGTARRSRRKPVVAAVVVFVVSMLGITGFELVSGNDLSGGNGTTVGSVVRGGDARTADPRPPAGTEPGTGDEQPGTGPSGTPGTGTGTGTGQDGDGASAPATTDDDGASTVPAPSPTDGATTPAPSRTPAPESSGDGASTAPEQTADGTGTATEDPAAGGDTGGE